MQFRDFFQKTILVSILGSLLWLKGESQPISGVWKGKMGSYKVELKLVRKGDSLIGTSYYYDSKSNYIRYSIKGYFDDKNNDVIWWDDALIEKSGSPRLVGGHQQPQLAVADFNCPGEGVMKLDGKTSRKDDDQKDKKELHLQKGNNETVFPDEWDFLIENYVYALMHPQVVDSIEDYALQSKIRPEESTQDKQESAPLSQAATASAPAHPAGENIAVREKPGLIPAEQSPLPSETAKPAEQTNSERLASREKILQLVIPVKGDSVELRFYDNAEIDGDSIAVFLNGRLLKEHILLAEQAYIMKIAISDLQPDNELVMVAENLGSIPPNTSLMVAIVEDKRYEAHLESTMGSSALVRLVKP
jgi:hypothetical protein